ncbi:MAG: class A beta-lactamase-related serine hydrolase [Endomicrobia bacterium]|nr:class A beta-lactamase-related serine hydrolase [Endomicrobiia bacterium]
MKDITKNLRFLISILNIAILLIIVVFIAKINSLYTTYEIKVEKFHQLKNDIIDYLEVFKDSDAQISIYIKDISTDYTINIESEKLIPSASLLKIPIMAAVYYLQNIGELSLNEVLVYKRHHRCGGSGIIKNMAYGSKFEIRQLIEYMITISDNIATHMLMERIGIKRLNEIFIKLGLEHTNIERYIMDLRARDKGVENYTTAKDIGLLLEKIYKGKLVSKQASIEMLSFLMKQQVDDRIPRFLPEEIVVAHKTGLMKNVCHDAGIVFTGNGDFIICVLTKNLDHRIAKRFIAEVAYKTFCLYKKAEKLNGISGFASRSNTRDN